MEFMKKGEETIENRNMLELDNFSKKMIDYHKNLDPDYKSQEK